MACNCEKKSDDNLPGVPTPTSTSGSVNWNMILLILLILAIGWYFFLQSKGPVAFFEK